MHPCRPCCSDVQLVEALSTQTSQSEEAQQLREAAIQEAAAMREAAQVHTLEGDGLPASTGVAYVTVCICGPAWPALPL